MRDGSESVYMTGDAIILSVFERMATKYLNKKNLFCYLDNKVNYLHLILGQLTSFKRHSRSIDEIMNMGAWSAENGAIHMSIDVSNLRFKESALECTEVSNKTLVCHVLVKENRRYKAMMTKSGITEEFIDFYKSECVKYHGMNKMFHRFCKKIYESEDEIEIDEKLKEMSEYLGIVEGTEQGTMQNIRQE